MFTMIKKSGFTIIEIIVVIAIIALVTGILTPIIFKYLNESNETATLEEMSNIRDAIIGKNGIGGYYEDLREFPPKYVTDGKFVYCGLIVLNKIKTTYGDLIPCKATGQTFSYGNPITPAKGNSEIGWKGPYIMDSGGSMDFLKDSWDRAYIYKIEPYEYDTFKRTPEIVGSAQIPPDYVFLASKGPDGMHTRVEVKDNRMDGLFKLEKYRENMDDIVIEIYTSPQAEGFSLLKKQDWPQ
jgi:prepilin-type N-terminal cleavage/methylation domain-containing protein